MALLAASYICLVGTIIQAATHNVGTFVVGRISNRTRVRTWQWTRTQFDRRDCACLTSRPGPWTVICIVLRWIAHKRCSQSRDGRDFDHLGAEEPVYPRSVFNRNIHPAAWGYHVNSYTIIACRNKRSKFWKGFAGHGEGVIYSDGMRTLTAGDCLSSRLKTTHGSVFEGKSRTWAELIGRDRGGIGDIFVSFRIWALCSLSNLTKLSLEAGKRVLVS